MNLLRLRCFCTFDFCNTQQDFTTSHVKNSFAVSKVRLFSARTLKSMYWSQIFFLSRLSSSSLFQASVQRVHRPTVPGPLAAGELTAAAHPRTGNPELFDPLQSNLARFRDPGIVRGRHGLAELSDRGYQSHGQNVPQQQPQQSLR